MIKENVNVSQKDHEQSVLGMLTEDLSSVHMTGQITDRIFKNGVLVEEIVGHNLVVNSFLNLIMYLLKHQSGYSGIQYWAIGSGAESWDSSIPTPDINATTLTAELGRVPISADEITFLDPDFNEVSTPTNILQIKHTFGSSECNGVWREFGIFGGNATESLNSGILINKRHHAIITKTEDMTVERTMRFTLNLT